MRHDHLIEDGGKPHVRRNARDIAHHQILGAHSFERLADHELLVAPARRVTQEESDEDEPKPPDEVVQEENPREPHENDSRAEERPDRARHPRRRGELPPDSPQGGAEHAPSVQRKPGHDVERREQQVHPYEHFHDFEKRQRD